MLKFLDVLCLLIGIISAGIFLILNLLFPVMYCFCDLADVLLILLIIVGWIILIVRLVLPSKSKKNQEDSKK